MIHAGLSESRRAEHKISFGDGYLFQPRFYLF